MAATGGIRAGRAFVELGLNQGQLAKGLKQAQAKLQAFGKAAATIGAGLMGASAAVLAPLMSMVSGFSIYGDKLHKMSARTGVMSDSLSELGFAAEQSGSSLDAVGNALFRMRRRVANASTGSGPAARALGALGLSAEEITQLTPEEQLLTVADALQKVENESLAAQYAFEIFGDGAKGLLPLLQEGADGIEALMEEARDLGISVSPEDAQAAADYGDAWNRISTVLSGVRNNIGAALIPVLNDLLATVTPYLAAIGKWVKENRQLAVTIAKIAAAVGAAGAVLVALGGAAMVAASGIGALLMIMAAAKSAIAMATAAVTFLVTPLGAAVGVIGVLSAAAIALGSAFIYFSGAGTWAIEQVSQALQWLRSSVFPVLESIYAALTSGRFGLAGQILWASLRVAFFTGMQTILESLKTWESHVAGVFGRIALKARQAVLQAYAALPGISKETRAKIGMELLKIGGQLINLTKTDFVGDQLEKAKQDLADLQQQVEVGAKEAEPPGDTGSIPGQGRSFDFQLPNLDEIGSQVQEAWQVAVGTTNSFAAGRIGLQARPLEKIQNTLAQMDDKLARLVDQGEEGLVFGD